MSSVHGGRVPPCHGQRPHSAVHFSIQRHRKLSASACAWLELTLGFFCQRAFSGHCQPPPSPGGVDTEHCSHFTDLVTKNIGVETGFLHLRRYHRLDEENLSEDDKLSGLKEQVGFVYRSRRPQECFWMCRTAYRLESLHVLFSCRSLLHLSSSPLPPSPPSLSSLSLPTLTSTHTHTPFPPSFSPPLLPLSSLTLSPPRSTRRASCSTCHRCSSW